jgi:hypothetical protein
MAGGNGDILIAHCIASTDFRSLCVEGDSEWTTLLCFFCSARMVNYALVILNDPLIIVDRD